MDEERTSICNDALDKAKRLKTFETGRGIGSHTAIGKVKDEIGFTTQSTTEHAGRDGTRHDV